MSEKSERKNCRKCGGLLCTRWFTIDERLGYTCCPEHKTTVPHHANGGSAHVECQRQGKEAQDNA